MERDFELFGIEHPGGLDVRLSIYGKDNPALSSLDSQRLYPFASGFAISLDFLPSLRPRLLFCRCTPRPDVPTITAIVVPKLLCVPVFLGTRGLSENWLKNEREKERQ